MNRPDAEPGPLSGDDPLLIARIAVQAELDRQRQIREAAEKLVRCKAPLSMPQEFLVAWLELRGAVLELQQPADPQGAAAGRRWADLQSETEALDGDQVL